MRYIVGMVGILLGNSPKLSVDFPFLQPPFCHLWFHFSEFSSEPVEWRVVVEGIGL